MTARQHPIAVFLRYSALSTWNGLRWNFRQKRIGTFSTLFRLGTLSFVFAYLVTISWLRRRQAVETHLSVELFDATYLLMSLVMASGWGQLVQARREWDLPWLFSLPMSSRNLVLAKGLARGFTSPSAFLWVGSCLVTVFFSEPSIAGFFAAAVFSLGLCLLVSTTDFLLEITLRARFSARNRRWLALMGALLGTSLYFGVRAVSPTVLLGYWDPRLTAVAEYAPILSCMTAVRSPSLVSVLIAVLGLCAPIWMLSAFAQRSLARGLLSEGDLPSESGRAQTSSTVSVNLLGWFGPWPRRELLLWWRSGSVAALLVFLLIGVLLSNSNAGADGKQMGVGFGAMSGLMIMGILGFYSWRTEGQTLGLLLSLPRPFSEFVTRKGRFWGAMCVLAVLLSKLVSLLQQPSSLRLWSVATQTLGAWSVGYLAVALGFSAGGFRGPNDTPVRWPLAIFFGSIGFLVLAAAVPWGWAEWVASLSLTIFGLLFHRRIGAQCERILDTDA